jgi:hypothetical protein
MDGGGGGRDGGGAVDLARAWRRSERQRGDVARRSLSGLLVAAAALALACEPDRTAIVLEAVNEAPEPIEEVVFRVSGPGLDGGSQEAAAAVSGPDARSFPLTLVLLGASHTMAGPYQVSIEGRRSGQAVAQAVRTDGQAPVVFSPGKVMHYRFALRASAAPQSTPPPMTTPTPTPMPPPMTPPPQMPPPSMPPTAEPCTVTDTCAGDHHCACAAGCACQFTCGPDHCVARCDGAGTSCEIDVAGTKMANVDCAGGAACLLRGALEKGDVHLGCAGAKPLDCGNDVQVCNRSCP